MINHRQAWRWILFFLVLAVCYLALTPRPPKAADLGWDKLNHAMAFSFLTTSARLGFADARKTAFSIAVALIAFGGLIEVAQMYVPGRSAELLDLVADTVGVALGSVLAAALRRFRTTS